MDKTIVAASRNRHKIEEIEAITRKFGMRIISRDEAGVPPVEIEEDGDTFEANSLKKAEEIMKLCGKITLADDSGLMVDYLGGAPGVYSARFAGEDGNDKKNNEKLLKELKGVPKEKRGAQFICQIVLVDQDEKYLSIKGEVRGRILEELSGKEGFGYDPVFFYEPLNKTFGELSSEEKNSVSHRACALRELKKKIKEFLN